MNPRPWTQNRDLGVAGVDGALRGEADARQRGNNLSKIKDFDLKKWISSWGLPARKRREASGSKNGRSVPVRFGRRHFGCRVHQETLNPRPKTGISALLVSTVQGNLAHEKPPPPLGPP
jgi:hypothetical protein